MRQIAPLEIGECLVDILSSILYLSIGSHFNKIYFGIVGVVKQMWLLPGQGKRRGPMSLSEKVSIPLFSKVSRIEPGDGPFLLEPFPFDSMRRTRLKAECGLFGAKVISLDERESARESPPDG